MVEVLEASDDRLTAEQYDAFLASAQSWAVSQGNWAGIPVPVHEVPLTLAPSYPYPGLDGLMFYGDDLVNASEQASSQQAAVIDQLVTEGVSPEVAERIREYLLKPDKSLVNEWYSHVRDAWVSIWEDRHGCRSHTVTRNHMNERARDSLDMQVRSMGVATEAWKLEVELAAQEKLKQLISPHLFTAYQLTGSFIETSSRSNVTYLFRRCRPTVAMVADKTSDKMLILSVLCMHPIGYYQGTWVGSMVPTDDILAHLLLMRGDEHMYWRKANHHEYWSELAGL